MNRLKEKKKTDPNVLYNVRKTIEFFFILFALERTTGLYCVKCVYVHEKLKKSKILRRTMKYSPLADIAVYL